MLDKWFMLPCLNMKLHFFINIHVWKILGWNMLVICLTTSNEQIKLLVICKEKCMWRRNIIWVKVFKNGPSKICGRQPLKIFTWSFTCHFTHFSHFSQFNSPFKPLAYEETSCNLFSQCPLLILPENTRKPLIF